ARCGGARAGKGRGGGRSSCGPPRCQGHGGRGRGRAPRGGQLPGAGRRAGRPRGRRGSRAPPVRR
ncbi:unnamed protein product, partial [Prorocentrum cordatum]